MKLAQLVENADLPASIDVITKLQQSIANGIDSASAFAEKLTTDPGLSARVLRLANSAFYGQRNVENVEQAVIIIGENDLVSLVISTEVINAFQAANHKLDMRTFWQQNIFTAISAKIIARRLQQDKGRLFTIGLLRCVGQLLIHQGLPTAAEHISKLSKANPDKPLHHIETEVLKYNHAEISAHLLAHWQLPSTITQAIRYYLQPDTAPEDCQLEAAIVYLAHLHTQTHFECELIPDWIDSSWLDQLFQVPCEALLAEAGGEVEAHYERTLAMIMGNADKAAA